MRFFLLVELLLLTLTLSVKGQTQPTPMTQSTRDVINLSGLKVPSNGSVLYGFDNSTRQLLGDGYLDTTFTAGNIHFYSRISMGKNDSIMGVPIRLDLLSNEIEIRVAANDIRVAKGPAVTYFDMNAAYGKVSRYVNVYHYQGDATALSGFFEWVVPGKLDLMLHTVAQVKKANYSAALNVGSRDDEIVKKATWYVVMGGKASKFSPGKRALLALMADKQEQIEQFLKDKNPDLKTREGLMAVFAQYNQR